MVITKNNIKLLRELVFGTKIQVRWHAVGIHDEGDTDIGLVFGSRIGYTDGTDDKLRDIARCIEAEECEIYYNEKEYMLCEANEHCEVTTNTKQSYDLAILYANCKEFIEALLERRKMLDAGFLYSFVIWLCEKKIPQTVYEYYSHNKHLYPSLLRDDIICFICRELGNDYSLAIQIADYFPRRGSF